MILWGPVRVGSMGTTLVAPAGVTLIIKNVRIVRSSADLAPVLVRLGRNGVADDQLYGEFALGPGPLVFTDGTWLVLGPESSLVMSVSGGEVTTSGHGTRLLDDGTFG